MMRKGFQIALLGLFLPMVASAAGVGFPYWGVNPPLLSCVVGTDDPGHACNICQLFSLFQRVVYLALTLLLFTIVPILVGIGGFLVIFDMGSEERVRRGKKMISGALIGAVIGLAAFVIVNTFFFIMGITVGAPGSSWATIVCT